MLRLDWRYLLGLSMGLLIGYEMGIAALPWSLVVPVVVAWFLVPIVIWSIGGRSHRARINRWDYLRTQGVWRFVLMHYVLYLGVPVSLLVYLWVISLVELARLRLELLPFIVIPTMVGFIIMGYQEWSECEREFQEVRLRKMMDRLRTQSIE